MRDLAITIGIALGMLASLASPYYACLNLMWIWFMKPYEFSWGFWNGQPVFKIALGMLLLSLLIHPKRFRRITPNIWLFLVFSVWLYICCLVGFNPKISMHFYMGYWVTMAPVCLMLLIGIKDLKQLKWVFFATCFSLGLVAAKTGLSLSLSGGGHITDRISGFAGDNNTFGAALSLSLACLIGFKCLFPKAWMRFGYNIFLLCIILCMLYTKSRGAFLTLSLISVVGSVTSVKPVRNTLVLCLLVVLGYFVLPKDMFNRLGTLKDPKQESSAAHRLDYWAYAWKIGLAHPVTGIGINNFMGYTKRHFPERFSKGTQVEHSTVFQVLTCTGFPGLGLYLLMMGLAFADLRRSARLVRANRSLLSGAGWVIPFSFWARVGIVGYNFGSLFVNMLLFELPWVVIWLTSLMPPLIEREIASAKRKAARRAAAAAEAAAEEAGDPSANPPEGAALQPGTP